MLVWDLAKEKSVDEETNQVIRTERYIVAEINNRLDTNSVNYDRNQSCRHFRPALKERTQILWIKKMWSLLIERWLLLLAFALCVKSWRVSDLSVTSSQRLRAETLEAKHLRRCAVALMVLEERKTKLVETQDNSIPSLCCRPLLWQDLRLTYE